jgi:hypothetical protein
VAAAQLGAHKGLVTGTDAGVVGEGVVAQAVAGGEHPLHERSPDDEGAFQGASRFDRVTAAAPVAGAAIRAAATMSEQSTDTPQAQDRNGEKGSTQRGEAAPEAASPFTDEGAEQADREGRHVDDDVEDNADLDG